MLSFSFVKNTAKTSLFTLALVALLSMNAFATPPAGVSSFFKVITDGNSQSIALYIPQTDTEKVTVAIKNSDNEILFQKRAKVSNGFAQKFNLDGLDNGQYQMVVTDESKVVKQAFEIADSQVKMQKTEQLTFKHPIIQYNNAQKLMQTVAFENLPLQVTVYDAEGNAILSEIGTKSSKAYNFSVLKRGEYTIKANYGGESYYKQIRL